EGLPPGCPRTPLARLPAAPILPPLLRRVSRAPGGARSRGARRNPDYMALIPEPRVGRPQVAPRARGARSAAEVEALSLKTPPCGAAGRGNPGFARRRDSAVAPTALLA